MGAAFQFLERPTQDLCRTKNFRACEVRLFHFQRKASQNFDGFGWSHFISEKFATANKPLVNIPLSFQKVFWVIWLTSTFFKFPFRLLSSPRSLSSGEPLHNHCKMRYTFMHWFPESATATYPWCVEVTPWGPYKGSRSTLMYDKNEPDSSNIWKRVQKALVARKFSHFCKMARRPNLVEPHWLRWYHRSSRTVKHATTFLKYCLRKSFNVNFWRNWSETPQLKL